MAEERWRLVTTGNLKDFAPDIQEAIRRELSSDEMVKQLSATDPKKAKEILDKIAAKVTEDIKKSSFITVDLSSFSKKLGVLELPLGAIKNMDSLTDEVFVGLEGAVQPWTYGNDWVIRDKSSKDVFRNLRMEKKARRGVPMVNAHTMEAMGIKAGMILEVVRPHAK